MRIGNIELLGCVICLIDWFVLLAELFDVGEIFLRNGFDVGFFNHSSCEGQWVLIVDWNLDHNLILKSEEYGIEEKGNYLLTRNQSKRNDRKQTGMPSTWIEFDDVGGLLYKFPFIKGKGRA